MKTHDCAEIMEILSSSSGSDFQAREQALVALGEMVESGEQEGRDCVLEIMPLLTDLAKENADHTGILLEIAWIMSLLCETEQDIINPSAILPLLSFLLQSSHDDDVAYHTCWSLVYLARNTRKDGAWEAVIADIEILHRVGDTFAAFTAANGRAWTSALRLIGDLIVRCNNSQTQILLNETNCLIPLRAILSHPRADVRKEAFWVVSNIAAGAGAIEQVQTLAEQHNIFGLIINALKEENREPPDVILQAVWTVSNIAGNGYQPHIRHLFAEGVVTLLLSLSSSQTSNINLVLVALDALDNFFHAGFASGADGEILDRLRRHNHAQIAEKACGIIDRYFEEVN